MKKYILILLLLLLSYKGFSQETAAITKQTSGNYLEAEVPGGDEAFWKQFMNMVHANIDGKMNQISILPKFKNNEIFIDDMKYVAKKGKDKWISAAKDGISIDSKFVMRIIFSNNVYDHD